MQTKPRAAKVMRDRYSNVAIAFHWTIAALIVVQLALGWRMGDLEGLGRSILLNAHKTVGISILVLTALRLVWRLVNPAPPHGTNLHHLEKLLAHWVHIGFYASLFALPLTGWAMVSLQRPGAMKVFGALPWPAFPGVSLVPVNSQDAAADWADTIHGWLVWVMLALLALHIVGAIKHHFISKDRTISRMAPGVEPGSYKDRRLWAIPATVAIVAAVIYLPKLPEAIARPKPASVGAADIYADLVGPSLERRCGFCHSEDVSKGGLSLGSYQAVMAGGRHGRVIVPGKPERSELFHRITLPTNDPKYMPQAGKPPLGASEIEVIRAWIAAGAPASGRVSTLHLSPAAMTAVKTLLTGDAGDDQAAASQGPVLPTVAPADKGTIVKLEGEGFIVRAADKASNLLIVDYISPKPVTPEAIADLGKIGTQVLNLNLRHAGLTDAEVKAVAAFPNLMDLRLEDNAVTDAGAQAIATAKNLTYLNLVGTKVTDAGIGALSALPKLERLYLWNTAVTAPAIDKLKAAHKGLFVSAGLTAKDVPVETKVMAPSN